MKIDNEFTVGVPVERAWEVLTDLEAIAPCMPGAQLTGVEDEVYTGKIKVKVGPVVSQYSGTARFLEKDVVNHRAVIDAKGRDSRGAGNASAAITAQLRADGDRTVVTVNTDLKISGKVAQLGSGMIKEVSAKLLAQFVACLEAKLTTPAPAADSPEKSAAPATEGGDTPADAPAAASGTVSTGDTPAASASADDAAALAAADTATTPVAPSAEASPTSAPESSSLDASAEGAGESGGQPASADDADAPAPADDATALVDASGAGSDAASGGSAADAATVPAESSAAASAGASAGGKRVIEQDEVEPLDIMTVAGASVYKRVIPLVVGIVVVVVAVIVVWNLVG
ncbi:SRPBCC family protein [Nonomuraea sp. NPDC048916]|uniref:SRPBCC family protein n=1 Tax=Nonomuraea sp. NPDC048916 TaxID=3154232 RepID=UPI0033E5527E